MQNDSIDIALLGAVATRNGRLVHKLKEAQNRISELEAQNATLIAELEKAKTATNPQKDPIKYPYVGECKTHGAIALFTAPDKGVLLVQGSSWVPPGTSVRENGFVFKLPFSLDKNAVLADREMAFLRLFDFDLSRGFWNEDLTPYKRQHPFAYDYLVKQLYKEQK